MDKCILGCTGLEVSRLCFGTIPFGGKGWRKDPYVAPEEAGKVLKRAHELGLNFWDTAEGYRSHPHIREGLKLVQRKSVVLSTKTTQTSYEGAKAALKKTLEELGTEYLDIYYSGRLALTEMVKLDIMEDLLRVRYMNRSYIGGMKKVKAGRMLLRKEEEIEMRWGP